MPGYVDFNYYEAFSGRVPEDVFLQYQPSAEQRLDVLTHRRAIDLPADDWRMEQVKSAVCSMIDYLAVSEELGQGIGVQSVSNAGYSETYADATPEAVENSMHRICIRWLSGTGLAGAL